MSTGTRLILAAAVSGLAACPAAWAGSIWQKSARRTQVLYTDDTARQVGDALTIIINERSVIENGTKRDMTKKSNRTAKVKSNIDLLRGLDAITGKLFNIPKADLSIDAETKFNGKADYDSDRSMVDQITVIVQDVLPNGNLVVVGTRQRDAAGDRQIVQISGVVRPSDISFANTVRSEQVADFHVVHKTKGQENRFTKPGWLDRVLNFLNPF